MSIYLSQLAVLTNQTFDSQHKADKIIAKLILGQINGPQVSKSITCLATVDLKETCSHNKI